MIHWQTFLIFVAFILAGCNLRAETTTRTPQTQAPLTPQQTQLTCGEIVTSAIDMVGNVCNNPGRNQVCYGHQQLETVFQSANNTPFESAGDIVSLTDIQRLDASPLDEINQTWGIAVLRAQVNLPETLPGQNVTFLLVGDTDLPDLTSNMRTFTVSTGLNTSTCTNAPPSAMLIQSPDNTQVTMTMNGATVTLGSTIYVTAIANNEMTIATLEGTAIVQALGISRIVQPGAQVRLRLGLEDGLTVIEPPSEPEAFDINAIRQLPFSLLERQITLPQPIDVQPAATSTNIPQNIAPPTARASGCILRDDWTGRYVIQSGDTLFNIANRFGLTVNELQLGNCIENANIISVGQELRVPSITTQIPNASPTPTNANFRAGRTSIAPRECTTIRWDVDNVDSVFFQDQRTTEHNAQSVCPSQTTTYTLLIIHPNGQQIRETLTIEVVLPQPTDTPIPLQQLTPTPIPKPTSEPTRDIIIQ